MLVNNQYFKEMTLPQRIKYLLQYYGAKIIIGAVIIALAIFLIRPLFLEKKNYNAYCLVLNDMGNYGLVEYIEKGFPEFLNDEKYLISVDNLYPFAYLEELGINWPGDSSRNKFFALELSNRADVVIADYNTMLYGVYAEFITPIDTILPEELLEKLEPYFVYANFKGQGENDGKVYGLDISETEVYKGHSFSYENAVLFIPKWTLQPEAGINFVKYCFGLKETL